MSARPRTLATAVAAAVLAISLTSCSSNGEACDNLEKIVNDLGTKAQSAGANPDSIEKTYSDSANQIRTAAGDASGDVKDEANKVATELETLGKQVGEALANPENAEDIANSMDPAKLEAAGKALEDACN